MDRLGQIFLHMYFMYYVGKLTPTFLLIIILKVDSEILLFFGDFDLIVELCT